MPNSVQNATPTLVMPWNLAISFQHSRQYPMIANDYANGENQRALLGFTSRKSWRLQCVLTPAQMVTLRNFYDSLNGMLGAFYFYDVFDTSPKYSYDNSGVSTIGRYTVVFTKEFNQVVGYPLSAIELTMEETA